MKKAQASEDSCQTRKYFSVDEASKICRRPDSLILLGEGGYKSGDNVEQKQTNFYDGYPRASIEDSPKQTVGRTLALYSRESFELSFGKRNACKSSRPSFDEPKEDDNLVLSWSEQSKKEAEVLATSSGKNEHRVFQNRRSFDDLYTVEAFDETEYKENFINNQLTPKSNTNMELTINPPARQEDSSPLDFDRPNTSRSSTREEPDPTLNARMRRRMEEKHRNRETPKRGSQKSTCFPWEWIHVFFSVCCTLCRWKAEKRRRVLNDSINDVTPSSTVTDRLVLLSHQFMEPSLSHQPLKDKFGEESYDSAEDSIFEDSVLCAKTPMLPIQEHRALGNHVKKVTPRGDQNSNYSITYISNPTVCSSYIADDKANGYHDSTPLPHRKTTSRKANSQKNLIHRSNQGINMKTRNVMSPVKFVNLSAPQTPKQKLRSPGDFEGVRTKRIRPPENSWQTAEFQDTHTFSKIILPDSKYQNSVTCCLPQTPTGSATDQFESQVLNNHNRDRCLKGFEDIDIEISESNGSVVAVIALTPGLNDSHDEKVIEANRALLSLSKKNHQIDMDHEFSKSEQLGGQNDHQDLDHLSVNLSSKKKRKLPKMGSFKDYSMTYHSRSVNELLERVSISSSHQQRKKDFFLQKSWLSRGSLIQALDVNPRESAASVFGLLGDHEEVDSEFVEKCHALVLDRKLFEPPVSVEEFMEKRVDPLDDTATKIIKAWAYLSCFPPMYTDARRTKPEELNLHPGVIARLLGTSGNEKQDPLRIYSAWDVCSKGLLHFYRSRYSSSNCHYHLFKIWKEILEMGSELSNKLRNLLALGNHPDYNIYDPQVSVLGDFFRLALNVFARNILVGVEVGRHAIHLSDEGILVASKVSPLKETNTRKSFINVISTHVEADPCFDIEGYQLYDQAKLLAPCIFNYFGGYVRKFEEVKVIYKPCRMHSRAHYYLLSDKVYECEGSQARVSYLSAPYLISSWLSAIFYFENYCIIRKFLNILQVDPIVEVVSIKDEMNSKSLIRVTVIVNNLEFIGKPPEAELSSFFLEIRLQYLSMWDFRKQVFRLRQIAVCEPDHLLRSQPIFNNLVRK